VIMLGTSVAEIAFAQVTNVARPRGVPGPIAGAGLPIAAIGYGIYWFVRRARRNSDRKLSGFIPTRTARF
jgi:hypothetical protein